MSSDTRGMWRAKEWGRMNSPSTVDERERWRARILRALAELREGDEARAPSDAVEPAEPHSAERPSPRR
jgi:hypothetical protein